MIACSPFYMPFSWAVILTQVGYIGWLTYKKQNLFIMVILTGIIGGAVIPLFEHWAKAAKWWYYIVEKMIYDTPYYIIFGEVLSCATLPVFFIYIFKKKVWVAPVVGIIEGFWIWVSYFIPIKTVQTKTVGFYKNQPLIKSNYLTLIRIFDCGTSCGWRIKYKLIGRYIPIIKKIIVDRNFSVYCASGS